MFKCEQYMGLMLYKSFVLYRSTISVKVLYDVEVVILYHSLKHRQVKRSEKLANKKGQWSTNFSKILY